jgi:alpha-beta hydrolase superfamily lysophospholipase
MQYNQVKHNQGTFTGFDGIQLYYQSWLPDANVQAVMVLVHGLGGHSSLFNSVVDYLVPQGFEVYAFDLRGHGRSPGQRGYINSWLEFREDLRAFLHFVQDLRSSCPCVLWGHSLGGTITLDYALHYPDGIQGLIVTAPALAKISIDPYKLWLGRSLSRIFPRFSLKLGISGGADDRFIRAFLQDPLRHQYGSARLATEFFRTVDWIYTHACDLKIPLLIMHGSADRVTLPEGSRAFFQRVIFHDKEHYEYPGNYHDLFADSDYKEIFSDLDNWLERHLEGTLCVIPMQSS